MITEQDIDIDAGELRVSVEERLFYGDVQGAIELYRDTVPFSGTGEARAFVEQVEEEMWLRVLTP